MSGIQGFQGGPTVSETPEQMRNKKEQDEQYEKQGKDYNDGKKLEKEREDLKNSLGYGNFVEKGNNESKEAEKQVENLEKFKENPLYPLLERYQEIPGIKKLTSGELNSIYNTIDGKSSTYIMDNFDDIIENIEFENPNTSDYLSNYIGKIKEYNGINLKKEKNKKKLNNGDYEIPKEFKNYDFLNDKSSPTIKLLTENYTVIPTGKEGKPDPKKDLETAFNIALNKLLETKQIKRTESLNMAIKEIKSGDIETKFYALMYVNSYVQTKEGGKGRKAGKLFNKIRKEHMKIKQNYFDFIIEKFEKQIKNERDLEKQKQLKLKLEEYKEEKNVDDFEGAIDNLKGNTKKESVENKASDGEIEKK